MVEAAAIAEMLGGLKVLKHRVRADADLGAVVREGLPPAAVRELAVRANASVSFLIDVAGLNHRTMERRLTGKAHLKKDESDSIVRVARVIAHATQTLGRERALQWLQLPNRALGGKKPIALLDTETDARIVEDVLLRIEHGTFS